MASLVNRTGTMRRFSSINNRRRLATAGAVGLVVAAISPGRARAAADSWVGNSTNSPNNNWSDGTNWLAGTAPASGDSLNFFAAGTSGTTLNDDLGAAYALSGIAFQATAGAYTVNTNNGSSISLSGNIVDSSINTQILNVPIVLAGNETLDTAYGNMVVNGVISGSGFGITKSGAGTLTLTAANTFTGGVSIGQASGGGRCDASSELWRRDAGS